MKNRSRGDRLVIRLMSSVGLFALAVVPLLFGSARAIAQDRPILIADPALTTADRRLLSFLCDGDVWISNAAGGDPRRVTTAPGDEYNPTFSPDGKWLAFTANYDGNLDVYVMESIGGRPTRLTWHPGADHVLGFTPDSKRVLFRSGRESHTRRQTQLFTVSVEGGELPARLPIPSAHKACYSPDGGKLAYTPLREVFNQWKNYRGGTHSRIWMVDLGNLDCTTIRQPSTRCNDTDPIWCEVGGKERIYFRSDRAGEFNLFYHDCETKEVHQVTRYADYPVINPSLGRGEIIFERGGALYKVSLSGGEPLKQRLDPIPADRRETRPRFVTGSRYVRSVDVSPTGQRVVVGFRGEVVTVPAKKGSPRNLTRSPGVHERSPVWSPDGKWIAYFSDESGEYEVKIAAADGKGEVQSHGIRGGAGFYEHLSWSPDSTKLAFVDSSMTLYWMDAEKGTHHTIDQQPLYGPRHVRRVHYAWSPDSAWIAYTKNGDTYIRSLRLFEIATGASTSITDGLGDATEPCFDASGKYLYFFGSTDAGPVRQWFAQSSNDMNATRAIYCAVLSAGTPSPFAPESDEEPTGADEEEADEPERDPKVAITLEGIDQRIVAFPLPAADYRQLRAGKAGEVFYLEAPATGSYDDRSLEWFRLKTREPKSLVESVDTYLVTRDGEKILYSVDDEWRIGPVGKLQQASKVAIDEIEVLSEPLAEWRQIFGEAWRINRDYFYAKNYHGADWDAMRKKYEPFVTRAATRRDLNRIIRWMCSELSVGHHGVSGGDRLVEPKTVRGGLLGADIELSDGRYRFTKVFGGLNWTPDLRAPLTEPGVGVRAGDYLLGVRGKELRAGMNPYRFFENTAGDQIEILVGSKPDGSDARTVTVVPIADERALRMHDWIERNRRRVDKATNGRVAYVYVRNTARGGHTDFKRYFFPQGRKDAIIIDERYNSGGQVSDYYIDHLRRPLISYWATRHGEPIRSPSAGVIGPKVMIIDESAGSGGDLFPWMFRKLGLGKLVGRPTWGGLVGVLGYPVLMDGGRVSAPDLAIYTEKGWIVENRGVAPDIEVEQSPRGCAGGRDPQLERAIEVVVDELERNPPRKLAPPPLPIRARQARNESRRP